MLIYVKQKIPVSVVNMLPFVLIRKLTEKILLDLLSHISIICSAYANPVNLNAEIDQRRTSLLIFHIEYLKKVFNLGEIIDETNH